MTCMHSEHLPVGAGWSDMQISTEYLEFAEECGRLAETAKTERYRKILEEMAEAWRKLAEEDGQ